MANQILSALDIPQQEEPLPAAPAAPPPNPNAPPPDMQLVGPSGLPPMPPPSAPQVAAPAFAPPGPTTATTSDAHSTFTAGHQVDPALQSQIHQSQAAENNAISQKTAIQAQTEEHLARVDAERARVEDEKRKADEAAALQRKAILDEHAQKIVDAQKAADEVALPAEETVGQHVLRAIALGLGAFGASVHGGPNMAAQVIDADRAKKMQTWKAQYDRAKGKVDSAQNLYALFRNKGLDEQSAEALSAKNLNEHYESAVKSEMAQSKAPITLADGQAVIENLKQHNLAQDQALAQAAQGTFSKTVDAKTATKVGGDSKEQKDLSEMARDDEYLKKYRLAQSAHGRFVDFTKAGATGAAFTDFVAGKGGMDQGSFGPAVQAMIHKNGWWGQNVEDIRAKIHGGVQPEVIKELSTALAIDEARTRQAAAPAIRQYRSAYARAGMDPDMVTGGDTADEAAAAAGATPSGYQGRK